MNKPFKITLILLFAIAASYMGYWTSDRYFNSESQENSGIEFETLLTYPVRKTFSGFELINHKNEILNKDDFTGHWTMLFFGFTSCPDVCPTSMTELQKVFNKLESSHLSSIPEVLFVSVDPQRDTPEKLNDYVGFFNPNFVAATGSKANILSLTSQIGVAYHIEEHQKGEQFYDVDHTAALFLINPERELYGIFRAPHEASKIADDLIKLLSQV